MAVTDAYALYLTSGDYSIATFQFPFVWEAGHDLTLTVFEDDATQSRLTSATKHRKATLVFASQSDAEHTSFETFHDARMNDGLPFFLNFPRTGELNVKVKFDAESSKVKYSCDSPRTWSWTAKVITVLS